MTLSQALKAELLELVRRDPDVRAELRALVAGDDQPLKLLSIGEAAALVKATTGRGSPRTIARWIRSGDLAATGEHKATRIRRTDLIALLERGSRRAVSPEDLADQEDSQ